MEGIFTLPYHEYDVINQMQKIFTKDDYSFLIPTSRQQKGFDFIILNNRNNKILKIQVKGSRAYLRHKEYSYTLWFNNFIEKCQKESAEVYILFGLYPNLKNESTQLTGTIDNIAWKSIILVFTYEEMKSFLDNVKTKKEGKEGHSFYICFNNPSKIFGERVLLENPDLTKYLLANKGMELLKKLE